jgi:hypothetical protein
MERAYIIDSQSTGNNKVQCTLLLNDVISFYPPPDDEFFQPVTDLFRCILNTKKKEFYLDTDGDGHKFSYTNIDTPISTPPRYAPMSHKAIQDFYSYFQTLANMKLTFDESKNRYLGTMINNIKLDTNYYYRTNLIETSFFNRKRNIGVSLNNGKNLDRVTALLFNPIITNEEFLNEQPIIGEIYYLQNDGTIKNLVTNYPLLVHLKNSQIITCPSLLNSMSSFYNLEEFLENNKEEKITVISNNIFKSFFNDTTINALVFSLATAGG